MNVAKPNFTITPFIDRRKIKLCRECKHFDSGKSKCTQFGRMNLVSGEIEHVDALICREYDMYCGNTARYHVDKDEPPDLKQ